MSALFVMLLFLLAGCFGSPDNEDVAKSDLEKKDVAGTVVTQEETLEQGKIISTEHDIEIIPVNTMINLDVTITTNEEISEVYGEVTYMPDGDGYELVTEPVDIDVIPSDKGTLDKFYDDGGMMELVFTIDDFDDDDDYVVFHFDEEGYEVLDGEVDPDDGTISVQTNSFSPFAVGKKGPTVTRWNKSDNEYIEVNSVYSFDDFDNTFNVTDHYVDWRNLTYWGQIADPTGSNMGQVLYCAAMKNGEPTGQVSGYDKKMKSVLEFAYENDKEDVTDFRVAFDAYMNVSGKMGYLNADYLVLQVRVSPMAAWTTLTPEGTNFKYITRTNDDWIRVEYDVTDIDTLTTWTGAQSVWGFHEYDTVYFRVLFKSGLDAGPDGSDGELKGAYIDNLSVDVAYESDENEAISELFQDVGAFYEGKSSFFKNYVESWMLELFEMSYEEVVAEAGEPIAVHDLQGQGHYYEFNGFQMIYYDYAPKPHTVAITHPGLTFDNIILGGNGEQIETVKPNYEHYTVEYFDNVNFYQYDYSDGITQTFAVETTEDSGDIVTRVTGMDLVREASLDMFDYEPGKDILDDVDYYMNVPYGELIAGKHGEVEDEQHLYGGDTSIFVNGYEVVYSGNENDDMMPLAVYYEGLDSYFDLHRWLHAGQVIGILGAQDMYIVEHNEDHTKQFSMNSSYEWIIDGPNGKFYLYFEKIFIDLYDEYVLQAVGFKNEQQSGMAIEERTDLEDFIIRALYSMTPDDIRQTLDGVTEEEGGMVNYLIYGDLTMSTSPQHIVDVSYTGDATLYNAYLGMTLDEARTMVGTVKGENEFSEDYIFLYFDVGHLDTEMKLLVGRNDSGEMVVTHMSFYSPEFINDYYSDEGY